MLHEPTTAAPPRAPPSWEWCSCVIKGESRLAENQTAHADRSSGIVTRAFSLVVHLCVLCHRLLRAANEACPEIPPLLRLSCPLCRGGRRRLRLLRIEPACCQDLRRHSPTLADRVGRSGRHR